MHEDFVSLEDAMDVWRNGEGGIGSWPDDDGYSPSTEREYEYGL